jgi:ubiquinone/menaquinone biosynthesis C-methylase UbiE
MENKHSDSKQVYDVFINVEAHRLAADLIRNHSTNLTDVRCVALDGLDLRHCRDILDIGCGFGFFTEALKGRIHPDSLITGIDIIQDYEPLFLEVCKKAGFHGRFFSSGYSLLKNFPGKSYDLVLCSYALYFFPEAIPDIAKVLKDSGVFVTITHDQNNMDELIDATKEILTAKETLKKNRLPFEDIVSRFSAENGFDRLASWFGRVETIDYLNRLVFRPEEIQNLVEYFRFKSPFFLAGTDFEIEKVAALLTRYLEESSHAKQGFTLSKNDRIFICSLPVLDGKPR